MFFSNLAAPVEITKEKIVISFANDMAVKQAEDDSKKIPLRNAALSYFGVSDIEIKIVKNSSDLSKKKVSEKNDKSELKDLTDNSSSNMKNETVVKASSEVSTEKPKNLKEAERPEKEEKPEKNNDIYYADISDTARMVIDLFDGKIID